MKCEKCGCEMYNWLHAPIINGMRYFTDVCQPFKNHLNVDFDEWKNAVMMCGAPEHENPFLEELSYDEDLTFDELADKGSRVSWEELMKTIQ